MRRLADIRGSDRDFIYLLMLARKYDLKPITLHNALVEARDKKRSECGPLSIEFRKRKDNIPLFMFSRNNRAVAQTPISEYTLTKLRTVPPELAQLLKTRNLKPKTTNSSGAETHIADLQVGLRHVNLTAKVIDKSKVRAVQSRDGMPLAMCSATLSDGTGQIQLPLWNNQINSIAKNDTVVIREATVRHFKGEKQLSIPRKTGSISIVR